MFRYSPNGAYESHGEFEDDTELNGDNEILASIGSEIDRCRARVFSLEKQQAATQIFGSDAVMIAIRRREEMRSATADINRLELLLDDADVKPCCVYDNNLIFKGMNELEEKFQQIYDVTTVQDFAIMDMIA